MASRSPGGALYVYVIDGAVDLERPDGETTQIGASRVYDGAGAEHRNLAAPERTAIEELLGATTGGRASLHEEPAREAAEEQTTGDSGPSGDAPATARDQRARPKQRHAVAASRRLVLAGDYRRAARRLRHHLKLQPEDGNAWALLGDCLRKTQQWRKAIAAYARAAETANGSVANRARFLAASIHQDQLDNPEIAARLLRVYLRQGPGLRPLEAAAMARLADALEESGDSAAARRIRERLVARDRAGASSDAPQRIDQEK
jgi:tetratricopeptide (TPR) repeat protein